ncbi:ABC transporter permease [Pseudoalteromonas phenolica]|uniref:ABC transporter permease n=1 Tax=Pseudoalteromonas phenolica TaxID=161398 RepID=A0A4V2EJD3_9GAMM|nr:ABC transporter permease [Pseudoalteromonas phenolica]RZQ51948.1 ABC transporter permease [Pseudoalteromonas phenolica]
MSRLNQTLTVAKWEFMQFFKWKQELIGKSIMLLLALGMYLWHNQVLYQPEPQQIVSNTQLDGLQLSQEFVFRTEPKSNEALIEEVKAGAIDGALIFKSTELPQQVTLYTEGKMSWQNDLSGQLNEYARSQAALSLNLSQTQLALLEQPLRFETNFLDDSVKDQMQQSALTANALLFLMAIGIFMTFGQVFVAITGEKQQRVTEQLYSCMDAQTWIEGKIIGQMLHAIKAMTTTAFTALLGMAFVQVILKGQTLDFSIFDFSVLPWFVLFVLVGIYMCTAFIAAIAAAIDDPNHSGKTAFMMIPLIPTIVGFMMMDSPSSLSVTVLSYFPLTAFVFMPMKMALIEVPFWQVIIAFISSIIGCIVIRNMAARMFKMGMTMYGKEPDLRTMLKWAVAIRS